MEACLEDPRAKYDAAPDDGRVTKLGKRKGSHEHQDEGFARGRRLGASRTLGVWWWFFGVGHGLDDRDVDVDHVGRQWQRVVQRRHGLDHHDGELDGQLELRRRRL